MRVLFIGGTGVISSACSRLTVERGIELYLLNRGESARPVPDCARVLRGNIRNLDAAKRVLQGDQCDAVVEAQKGISLLARLGALPWLPIGGALMSLLAIIPWWNTVVPGAKAGALFDLITLIALLPPWRERVMAYLGL